MRREPSRSVSNCHQSTISALSTFIRLSALQLACSLALSLHSHSAIPLSLQIALKPKFRVHGGNQLPILIGPLPKSTPSSAEFGHSVLSISVFIRHTHKHTHTLPLSHLFATNLVSSSIFFDSSSVYYSLWISFSLFFFTFTNNYSLVHPFSFSSSI